MRRHLRFFEDDVLTDDGIVLLELKLALLQALVLRGVVRKAGAGSGNEADVVAHGTRQLSRGFRLGNDLFRLDGSFSAGSLDEAWATWLTPRPLGSYGHLASVPERLFVTLFA